MAEKVKDIMSRSVVTIGADRNALEAARLMAQKGVGCLIVTSGNSAAGILTERDLVSRVLAEPFDPSKVLVGDIMTTPLFTISSGQTLIDVAEMMMKYKVRRLPVVDESRLVGLITASDLARALTDKVKDDRLIPSAIARYGKPSEGGPYM